MGNIDSIRLRRRFDLRKTLHLCERFDKSPTMTERLSITPDLGICYAPCDAAVLPMVQDLLLKTYAYVREWFGYSGELALDLWMAPTVDDLRYITCTPCGEGYACAPGIRNETYIVLLCSPLSSVKNSNPDRLSAVLVHEIAHHVIRDVSQSTVFSMRRRESGDVPMWLEEGLCQLIQSELQPSLGTKWDLEIARTAEWYPLEALRNDLSASPDQNKAYLQAYQKTKALVGSKGRAEIVRLLCQNRNHEVDWSQAFK